MWATLIDTHAGLSRFMERADAMDVLISLATNTLSEDQDYVASSVCNVLLPFVSDPRKLQSEIDDYMSDGWLDVVAQYVLNNAGAGGADLANTSSAFQDMVMRVIHLERSGHSRMARAIMCYATGVALYEWMDRQRGGVLYDEALHGPLRLAQIKEP